MVEIDTLGALLIVIVFILVLSMGSTVEMKILYYNLKHKKPFVIGVFCQFILGSSVSLVCSFADPPLLNTRRQMKNQPTTDDQQPKRNRKNP